MNNDTDRILAIFAHVLPLLGLSLIGPLIIYLIADETKPFAKAHARESLNFQITMLLAALVCLLLIWLVIPIILLIAIGIGTFILSIIAAIAASNNQEYYYPMSIKFIR